MGLFLCLLSGFAGAAEKTADKPKVAVLDLQAHGVAEETVATLTGILLSGLAQGGEIDLLGKVDLGKILSLEETKQLVGCPPADPRCVSEYGHALGNAILVWGSVGKLGNQLVISVAAVDIAASTTLGRSSRNVSAKDGAAQIHAVEDLAAEMRAAMGLESMANWQPIMAAILRIGSTFVSTLNGSGKLDTVMTSVEVEANYYLLPQLPLYFQLGFTMGSGEDANDENFSAYLVPLVMGIKYRFIRNWMTPYFGLGVGLGLLDLGNWGGVFTFHLNAGMEIHPPAWQRFAINLEGGFSFAEPFATKDLTQIGGRVLIGVLYRY